MDVFVAIAFNTIINSVTKVSGRTQHPPPPHQDQNNDPNLAPHDYPQQYQIPETPNPTFEEKQRRRVQENEVAMREVLNPRRKAVEIEERGRGKELSEQEKIQKQERKKRLAKMKRKQKEEKERDRQKEFNKSLERRLDEALREEEEKKEREEQEEREGMAEKFLMGNNFFVEMR